MITDRVMTSCRFSKMAAIWRPYRRKSTFAFWFYDASHWGRQTTIHVPNFNEIFHPRLRYYYFRLLKQTSPYSNSKS